MLESSTKQSILLHVTFKSKKCVLFAVNVENYNRYATTKQWNETTINHYFPPYLFSNPETALKKIKCTFRGCPVLGASADLDKKHDLMKKPFCPDQQSTRYVLSGLRS